MTCWNKKCRHEGESLLFDKKIFVRLYWCKSEQWGIIIFPSNSLHASA